MVFGRVIALWKPHERGDKMKKAKILARALVALIMASTFTAAAACSNGNGGNSGDNGGNVDSGNNDNTGGGNQDGGNQGGDNTQGGGNNQGNGGNEGEGGNTGTGPSTGSGAGGSVTEDDIPVTGGTDETIGGVSFNYGSYF